MALVQMYNRATGGHAHVPAKSVGAWVRRGWEPHTDDHHQPDEDSAAEADTTSRGKPSAKTTKDK